MCDLDLSNARVDDFGLDIFKHEKDGINYCLQYPYKNLTHQSQCSETCHALCCEPIKGPRCMRLNPQLCKANSDH